jgi:hypothetical protein
VVGQGGELGPDRDLRDGRPAGGSGTIAVGPALHVQVADRRTLNSGGVVPLALAVPAVLIVAAVATRRRAGAG